MLLQPCISPEPFDPVEAYGLALAAALARRDPEEVLRATARGWGDPKAELHRIGADRVLISETAVATMIVFVREAGTTEWPALLARGSLGRDWGEVLASAWESYAPFADLLRPHVVTRGSTPLRISGHGLGGALATIALLETPDAVLADRDIKALTFGAPRIVGMGSMAAGSLRDGAMLRRRLVHVVNDDDLVSRLQEGYQLPGTLIWIDERGRPHPGEERPMRLHRPLPQSQMGQFAIDLARLARDPDARLSRGATATGDDRRMIETYGADDLQAMLYGLHADLRAHAMDSYLRVLRRMGGPRLDDARLQPSTLPRTSVDAVQFEAMVQRMKTGFPAPRASASRGAGITEATPMLTPPMPDPEEAMLIPVLVDLVDAERWTPPPGLSRGTVLGGCMALRVTAEQLDLLRKDPQVRFAAISREGGTTELHNALAHTCSDDGQFTEPDQIGNLRAILERGDSALFAMIDTGIDVLHEAFRDATGASRIIGIWDQTDKRGPHPNQIDPAFGTDLGRLYTACDIAACLAGGAVPAALRDPRGHGTHVASIAAGRAFGSNGRGMAPDARILVVIPATLADPSDPTNLGYSYSHFQALAFIQQVARGQNALLADDLPVAINVSLGCNTGGHDGRTLLEASIDGMTRMGRTPGCVVVKSAGNDRDNALHASLDLTAGTPGIIRWQAQPFPRVRDYFEVWFNWRDEMEFILFAPDDGRPRGPLIVNATQPAQMLSLGGNLISLRLTVSHSDNGDSLLAVEIASGPDPIRSGTWELQAVPQWVGSEDKRLHVWVESLCDDGGNRPIRFDNPDPRHTLSIPGTAETVITVAACDGSAQMAAFSALGRTRVNGPKPDVCAPGCNILAAAANAASNSSQPMSGTSMSAPQVAGLMLLAMSRREKQVAAGQQTKQLCANELRGALLRSASGRHVPYSPDNGFGMIHAADFMRQVTLNHHP